MAKKIVIEIPTGTDTNTASDFSEQILKDLEQGIKHSQRLPVSYDRHDVLKYRGEFYKRVACRGIGGFEVKLVEKIDFSYWNPVAVSNLRQIIDEDISAADGLIIRDIAIESFYRALEYSAKYKTLGFTSTFRTERNEGAMIKLESFGFKVNNPRFTCGR